MTSIQKAIEINQISQTSTQPSHKYPCPTCGKLSVWQGNAFRPFCSSKCKLIDFGDWANETHRIPSHHESLDEIFDGEI